MSTFIDTITAREKNFRASGGANYKLSEATLAAGGASVDVVDCKRSDAVESYFYKTEHTKTKIVIHHTAGQLLGDIPTLTKVDYHVSVAFVIARDGTIYRLFNDEYWSYHLGGDAVGGNGYVSKRSIAIELSNYGWLTKVGDNLLTYAGNVYCQTHETAYYTELGSAWRQHAIYSTFTDAQYRALARLLAVLCAKHDIPYKLLADGDPASAARYRVFPSLEDARGFAGITSHANFRADKWDIGPAFDWARIEEAGLEMQLPVDLGAGRRVLRASLDHAYGHTEKVIKAGYFPLGINTVWHGGVHLHGSRGQGIYSIGPGRIVAARLPSAASRALGHYGSHNFILTRHEVQRQGQSQSFYSLYMHLNNEALEATNAALRAVPWIWRPPAPSTTRFRVSVSSLNFRSSKDTASADNILGRFALQEEIERLEPGDPWWRVRRDDGSEGYVWYRPDWIAETLGEPEFDRSLADSLDNGQIVAVDRTVELGARLWTMGEYGSERHRRPLLHWELFSECNLFSDRERYSDWLGVEDGNQDFNVDNQTIVRLVDQEAGWFESDEILTASELQRFYTSQNAHVRRLRRTACRFVSEWGVDLEKAVDAMLGRFSTIGLADRLRPYSFWSELAALGVVPKSAFVWHYNPIAFVEALVDPLAIAPRT